MRACVVEKAQHAHVGVTVTVGLVGAPTLVADSSHQFCAQAVKNVRTRRSEACGVATERWSEPSIAVGCRTVPIHRSSECTAPSHSTRVCKWSRVRLFESDVGLTSAGPAVQPNPTNSYSVVRYTHVPLFPWTNSRMHAHCSCGQNPSIDVARGH